MSYLYMTETRDFLGLSDSETIQNLNVDLALACVKLQSIKAKTLLTRRGMPSMCCRHWLATASLTHLVQKCWLLWLISPFLSIPYPTLSSSDSFFGWNKCSWWCLHVLTDLVFDTWLFAFVLSQLTLAFTLHAFVYSNLPFVHCHKCIAVLVFQHLKVWVRGWFAPMWLQSFSWD